MGATNRLDMMDEALLRPGRFDRIMEVPKPDAAGRVQILRIHARGRPLDGAVDYDRLADQTDGMGGAELRAVVDGAAMAALRRHVRGESAIRETRITQRDFEGSVGAVRRERAP